VKIFLHVIVFFLLWGCNESHPKSHNYLSQNTHTLIYPKEANDTEEEATKEKAIFKNEQIINAQKIQKKEPSSSGIFSLWWIVAIALSLIIIVYYLRRLAKKNRQMLDILQEKF